MFNLLQMQDDAILSCEDELLWQLSAIYRFDQSEKERNISHSNLETSVEVENRNN